MTTLQILLFTFYHFLIIFSRRRRSPASHVTLIIPQAIRSVSRDTRTDDLDVTLSRLCHQTSVHQRNNPSCPRFTSALPVFNSHNQATRCRYAQTSSRAGRTQARAVLSSFVRRAWWICYIPDVRRRLAEYGRQQQKIQGAPPPRPTLPRSAVTAKGARRRTERCAQNKQ